MLENYLSILEICLQLNLNQTLQNIHVLEKYETLLNEEYEKLSEEDKEILNQILKTKITTNKIEKSTITLTQDIILRDRELKLTFPGHIKAQYSDKLKKSYKELHYLQTIYNSINKPKRNYK